MIGRLQDLRYALRQLCKKPGFTTVAILTLALGMGSSTAVFSIVNTILLKPLPYAQAERIVIPWRIAPPGTNLGAEEYPWGERDFRSFSQGSKTFQELGAFKSDGFNLTGSGEPALLEGLRASAGFFPALGVAPSLGRIFTPKEDVAGNEHEVILSDQFWRERFGGDRSILGRGVELNGYAYTVIGVMPPGFTFPQANEMPVVLDFPREPQLWVPLAVPVAPANGPSELVVIGRLKPGITIAQAQADWDITGKQLENQPGGKGWYNSRLTPLARQVAGDTRRPLLLLLGAVGVVLLIACSNVANLLLARSVDRRKEFTVRAALGAGRGRIISQLLTESLVLAAAGAALGLLVGDASIHFVKAFGPPSIPRLHEVGLDMRVLAFVFGSTLTTGVLFGLAPAFGAATVDLLESLKAGGQRLAGSASSPQIRNAILVSQVTLAMVLVIAAGLLVRTFDRMLHADAGFDPTRVLTFELSLPKSKYSDVDSMVALYRAACLRLQSLPGVEAAGLVSTVPMGLAPDASSIRIPGRDAANDREKPYVNYSFSSPGYFRAVRTPVLQGRDFLESDGADSEKVTIINQTMANKFWAGGGAIGKQVGVASLRWPTRTIVGIVADEKRHSLRDESEPEMFVPYTQNEIKIWPSMQTMQFALRAKSDPASLTGSVRELMHSLDPDLPLAKVSLLTTLVDNSLAQQRFSMLLLTGFGVLALLLSAVGMYGVISYSVTQRTREIGIRMALGAGRGSVFAMVVGQGSRLAGLGIALGLATALVVTRMMASLLYGIRATDPLTFAVVSVLLAGVALLACYIPARHATKVDPMVALRDE
jgi:predicted permease